MDTGPESIALILSTKKSLKFNRCTISNKDLG